MIMHMNYGVYPKGRILEEESSRLMQSPVIRVSDRADYGLAIRIARDLVDGKKLTGHTGSAYGLYSAMFFDPEKNSALSSLPMEVKAEKSGTITPYSNPRSTCYITSLSTNPNVFILNKSY